MLLSIKIKNYALIQSLSLDLNKGFNTITGETGAGKSILLGALGLLLGKRADSKVLLNDSEKCVVESVFGIQDYKLQPFFEEVDLDYENETVIRREIAPNGKSRAFINDTPVTLDTLKKLSLRLLDIHSQHENLILQKIKYHIDTVDKFAQNDDLKLGYKKIYSQYFSVKTELEELLSNQAEASKELDYFQFLYNELDEANLTGNEIDELEQKLKFIDNTEEIKQNLDSVSNLLEADNFSVLNALREALQQLNTIKKLSSEYNGFAEQLESNFHDLKELHTEVSTTNENLEYNQEEALDIRNRIDIINKLCQKHSVNNDDELITIYNDLADKLSTFSNSDDQIVALQNKEAELLERLNKAAKKLSKSRTNITASFETEITAMIQKLGMPNGVISIQHELKEFDSSGVDHLTICFSANKGVTPEAIHKIASGGEFSRLMFALKYILAQKTAMPTLIFDEIDSGISGEIAIQMGNMMKEMSKGHQLLTITHLPQVAAMGDAHYYVYKDHSEERTNSTIRQLNEDERIKAIAEMIGGNNYSSSAENSAKELLTGF